MNIGSLKKKVDDQQRMINILMLVAVALAFACALMALSVKSKRSEVLIVPSLIDDMLIQAGRVPDNYLLSMTMDLSNLLFQRHPHDTEYFKENIMRVTHPRYHPTISKQIAYDEENNKFKMGTRVFNNQTMCVVNGKRIETEVIGRVDIYINDKRDSSEKIFKRLVWALDGFQLRLADIYDVNEKDSACMKALG